jgi:hypothetical protein
MTGAVLPVLPSTPGGCAITPAARPLGRIGTSGMRGARTGLACGAAPGDPEPRTRTGRLPAGRAASWPAPASRALRGPADWPAAPLDPAVVQEARRHRSPGAGEVHGPPSRQESRTVADHPGTPPPPAPADPLDQEGGAVTATGPPPRPTSKHHF